MNWEGENKQHIIKQTKLPKTKTNQKTPPKGKQQEWSQGMIQCMTFYETKCHKSLSDGITEASNL